MVVLHIAGSEQDACVAQQHVSGRVRPAGSPLTSPPDPGQTRRTRRTAGPVRRERRQPGPGSAQEPAKPPLREARPPGDAAPHASCSCSQYKSTGWRRQRALPEGETSCSSGRPARVLPVRAQRPAGAAALTTAFSQVSAKIYPRCTCDGVLCRESSRQARGGPSRRAPGPRLKRTRAERKPSFPSESRC
jgi:hypothetical protein